MGHSRLATAQVLGACFVAVISFGCDKEINEDQDLLNAVCCAIDHLENDSPFEAMILNSMKSKKAIFKSCAISGARMSGRFTFGEGCTSKLEIGCDWFEAPASGDPAWKEAQASVLFHEAGHPLQDPGLPPHWRECDRYWEEYCRLRERMMDPGLTAMQRISLSRQMLGIQDWYPDFLLFNCDGPGGAPVPPDDPPADMPAQCQQAVYHADPAAGKRIMTSINRDGSANVKLRYNDLLDPAPVLNTLEVDTGLGSVTTLVNYEANQCARVAIVTGPSLTGGDGEVRVIIDSDEDGVPEDVQTIVPSGSGIVSPTAVLAMPVVGGTHKFYVFDNDSNTIYNLSDSDSDDVPDALGAVFADSVSFPELTEGMHLWFHGDMASSREAIGPTEVLFSNVDPAVHIGDIAAHWMSSFTDSDGDGTADSSTGKVYFEDIVDYAPVLLSAACAGATDALVFGVKGHTVQVVAKDAQGQFTAVLGSGVVPPAPYKTGFLLSRALVEGEEIIVRDIDGTRNDSDPVTVGPANRPWVIGLSPLSGVASGGTILTVTGTDFGPQTRVLFTSPNTGESIEAGVIGYTNTTLYIMSPDSGLSHEMIQTWFLQIADPRLQGGSFNQIFGYTYTG